MSPAMEIAPTGHWTAGDGYLQLEALLGSVAFGALDDMGWIRVTGADRVRWLNGMVTNSIQELAPGGGNYSFVLNAQGRIQGDLWTFADAGELLVKTGRDRAAAMIALFDRFIIMDEVELEDVSQARAGFQVVGPQAGALLESLGFRFGQRVRTVAEWRGGVAEVILGHSPLVPRFEVWTSPDHADALSAALQLEAARTGGGSVSVEAFEWLRLLEGTPQFGTDIRERDLAQETMQTRALHFAKGCYLGQEIVERIRSRGNVHRQFGAFHLEGPLPAAGAALEAGGKTVGELTSVATIPMRGGSIQVGLGYARREATGLGARLEYASPSGRGWALPTAVPMKLQAATEDLGITED